MSFKIDIPHSTLGTNLRTMDDKLRIALLMYMNTKATQLESLMKLRRPWTDRTNMAKMRLSAKVSQPNENTIRITLAHGVEYGIWLELANEQNYAIIGPTVRIEGPHILEDLGNVMRKLV